MTSILPLRARAESEPAAPGAPSPRGRSTGRRRATGSAALTPPGKNVLIVHTDVLSRAANPARESAPENRGPRTAAAPRTAEGGTTTVTEPPPARSAAPRPSRPMPKAAARGPAQGRRAPGAPANHGT